MQWIMPCPKPSGRNDALLEAAVDVECWWRETGPCGTDRTPTHGEGERKSWS